MADSDGMSLPDPGVFRADAVACARGGRPVFEGVAFILAAGDALVLQGPNGSGKSSLLRLLAGLLPPAAGTLDWGGEQVTGPDGDMAIHVGRLRYLGHQEAIKPSLSVREDLDFWRDMYTGKSSDGPSAAEPSATSSSNSGLDWFGIADLADLPCRYLSAGQRRRLALARLVVAPAPLWLLDEPSVALDAQAVASLEKLIDAHRRNGGRVVLSTHIPLRLEGAATLDMATFRPANRLPADPFGS